MSTLIAKTRFELKNIAGELGDARFRQEDIGFDRDTQTWNLVCWGPRQGRNSVRTERWQELRLTISRVVDYKPVFTEKVAYYEVSYILLSEDQTHIQISCHYGADLRLTIDELNVDLRQDDSAFKQKWDE
jgi:hypothetical protein